ncbi:hypothetical protein B0H67DRAFT_569862 [Lasiosphaeris hirsuta]|uniref:DUF6594 domain-containing protein n=1 Tax=Lasiosphaeris hirsuta TaxID=260670 RepID=A0AA40B0E4_9PEZI|nr:hypothetical protein B0H67DRAFT_569862 [Lasiosphaeris hirsuta]
MWLSKLFRRESAGDRETSEMLETVQIEDFPNGYPRYSALIATYSPFHISRRFSHLRIRLLLLKQDRLSMLEKQLEDIDKSEGAPLFLGSCRADANPERIRVLSEIDAALLDYDALLERNEKMLNHDLARSRDVASLENWLDGNACLARKETDYLNHRSELVSLASHGDSAVAQLETWIEDRAMWFLPWFRKRLLGNVSRDSTVYIFSTGLVARATRAVIACFFVIFLLAPAVICNFLTSLTLRTLVVVVATVLLIIVLSSLTRAKTVELFIAATAYTTLLVVFIANTAPGESVAAG